MLGVCVLAWAYALLVRLQRTQIHRRADETWVHSPHCMHVVETLGVVGVAVLLLRGVGTFVIGGSLSSDAVDNDSLAASSEAVWAVHSAHSAR